MLNWQTLTAGGAFQVYQSVRSFVVINGSNGAILEIQGYGRFPMPARIEFPTPQDVGFTPGATAPLQFVLDQGPQGGNWELDANPSLPQEGDLPPVASATVPGQTGVPLYRNNTTGKLTIPNTDAAGNALSSIVGTVPVSGTVTVTGTVVVSSIAGTINVDVTNFPSKQPITTPGATNVTYATQTSAATADNCTPTTGTGACRGFIVNNLGTVAADVLYIGESAAAIAANKLLAIVSANSQSEFIPYDFTNGTGTLFGLVPPAVVGVPYSITAYWG
jgi:hypothetical protein